MHTTIIAEIGVNHNGDVNLAKCMIDAAKHAGADVVKFQTFQAINLVSENAPKANYQLSTTNAQESQFEMLKKLQLSHSEFVQLKEYCDTVQIEFCSTPFSKEDAEFLSSLNVKTIKVASPDLVDRQLHEFLALANKKVILSTGMSTYQEVQDTLDIYHHSGRLDLVTLLLCTSAYPTNPEDVHLNSLATLRSQFGRPVGLSDHTESNYCSFAAVALGATVIERHFTLDSDLPGPDQKASSTPAEFADLVRGIRIIEKGLGSSSKTVLSCEQNTRLIARKSIVVARDLPRLKTIEEGDLAFKRPGEGISPMRYKDLIGKKLSKALTAGTQISAED